MVKFLRRSVQVEYESTKLVDPEWEPLDDMLRFVDPILEEEKKILLKKMDADEASIMYSSLLLGPASSSTFLLFVLDFFLRWVHHPPHLLRIEDICRADLLLCLARSYYPQNKMWNRGYRSSFIGCFSSSPKTNQRFAIFSKRQLRFLRNELRYFLP